MTSRSRTTTEPPRINLPPTHPGEVLADEIEELELSSDELARALSVHTEDVRDLLDGTRRVDAEMALRLARYFGTSAELWLNLQQSYDLRVAMRDRGDAIAKEVQPRAARAA